MCIDSSNVIPAVKIESRFFTLDVTLLRRCGVLKKDVFWAGVEGTHGKHLIRPNSDEPQLFLSFFTTKNNNGCVRILVV